MCLSVVFCQCVCVYICMYECMYVCIYICMFVCICVRMLASMYICMFPRGVIQIKFILIEFWLFCQKKWFLSCTLTVKFYLLVFINKGLGYSNLQLSNICLTNYHSFSISSFILSVMQSLKAEFGFKFPYLILDLNYNFTRYVN